jgi:hypothetical protein
VPGNLHTTLYPSAKFFLFITLGSDNKLIIMHLVSKTGTVKFIVMHLVSKTGAVTSELLCNLTVPLIGWSALELSVFCVEVSSVCF